MTDSIGDYYPEFAWRWSPIHEQTLPALPAAATVSDEQATATPDTTAPATIPNGGQFRGPAGTGVVDDQLQVTDWKANPPSELWRIQVGPGWSSFAFHNDRLFTQEQRGDNEYVTCYSATMENCFGAIRIRVDSLRWSPGRVHEALRLCMKAESTHWEVEDC